ncbi:bifunctional metallophosphatase/5'-nucleotidase [Streptomyces halstedii]|uniref:bifunctional metallophosphatase/5'-nucleotidase n=1 Tax=Streptomyces TaxID=1883 RepID=UPI00048C8933|nr:MULTISPECIES: 5'-nucleotidase C-terminal domain-containing protein [unclassified Streptomyces]MYR71535.1 bifunctional metallophosphatase/5'-nucleotidase [Streptomyces sp. SID4925]MYY14806.1 bifunctional metallophosphatase/5'-nucleotidase [Streptomyces sp. SID4912]SBV01018.1 2',3'-cyclic-nucleotide 2'-phosphodiesterase / 3'-nucleotidase [Streptomyces sp. OspMP-M45]SCD91557.1 2',3'-cyclic-nucleotide 2'-phosphodiesterase / 3'-nucleotidase [Streptomyces sp. DpondAA-D4]SCE19477.1 2',3'-cyclic-nu
MPLNRRTFLGSSAAAGAGAALAGGVAAGPAVAAGAKGPGHGRPSKRYSFTVMGTTDLHGNVFNWDYFTDGEFDDAQHNDVGLAKISTLVNRVRKQRGRHNTLLIDAGDTIQGTQLSYYYAKIDPITAKRGPVHPMARAMNKIGYDAAALGNHEFNYGIPVLRKFEEQCDFPLLGANALDAKTLRPAFAPYVIKRVRTPHGRDVRVAVLGLTNPGIAIWDKANVGGKMVFPGLEEQAAKWVPKLRSMGADVVIVSAHSGSSGTSSYGDQLPYVENAAGLVAERVPGIDAILVGHAHAEIPEYVVTNKKTGKPVVLSEPLKWGQRLTLFDFDLVWEKGRWVVEKVGAQVLNSNTVEEDRAITSLLSGEHRKVVAYVNQVIGTSVAAMSTAEAPWKDEPVIDLINLVQAETVREALAGGEYAGLPVLSQAACFSRTASIPAGEVTIKDAAGLYPFENTLEARLLTGAQLKDYLEYSARYYVRTAAGAPVDTSKLTNAEDIPDYNYDVVSGVTYDIDIAQPVGSRIVGLSFEGAPLDPAAEFVFAVNNYRASGGGNFPHVPGAKQLWADSDEIRNTIIGWVRAKGSVDPAEFASVDWRLTREGVPVF